MSKSEMRRAIAARLRSARQNGEISQPELARALGMSKQLISAWERGEAQLYAHQAVACAKILGVELNWLLLGEPGREAPPTRVEPMVPLLSSAEAAEFAAGRLSLSSVRQHIGHVGTGSDLPASGFALVIDDRSMAPVLEQGDIVLVNPENAARQGDLVVAALGPGNETDGLGAAVVVRQIGFLVHLAAPPLVLAPVSPDWQIKRIGSIAEGRVLGVIVALIRNLGSRCLKEMPESTRPMLADPTA